MDLKAALLSLGCKVNSYETERIREDMESKGFEIVDFSDKADVYIVNTCSVTNIADRKSRQMLHRAKTLNPEAIVVATGCYVQTEKDKERLNEVADILIGNNHKGDVADVILEFLNGLTDNKKRLDNIIPAKEDSLLNDKPASDISDKKIKDGYLDDISFEKKVEEFSITDYPERSRAFVRIEDGCNQFCSYCIIPYARGRVRSRDEADIILEVHALADKGFKEVVLTGIHISSYGYENYEKFLKNSDAEFDGTPLLNLVKKISEIKGIERIRLGSLEPRIITREFALGLKEIREFCPHFHLSLQSGCDTVLKRMNRHYTSEEFLEKCEILRDLFDRPAITTDVIVGFPGETDEEFENSRNMCEKAGFAKMHIFKFSRRKGTVADRMPGQLTEKEKHARSLVLQELDDRMKEEYLSSFIGEDVKILVEETEGDCVLGLTERYVQVKANVSNPEGPANCNEKGLINSIISVKIDKILPEGILFGKVQKNT
ncbi:MAG: tRNA (N(6)-L-threonylcarbamoyladenosine(37)-C(2))-methylthiotransferase MtaB [Lachnospiraceae bacterium]|nr:tRNA (N(6)-L-threonylcarbamoyladenosine(37)-C(2))-methylthiotransferase MtaB [Lachnospiraceae bacterium]